MRVFLTKKVGATQTDSDLALRHIFSILTSLLLKQHTTILNGLLAMPNLITKIFMSKKFKYMLIAEGQNNMATKAPAKSIRLTC